MATTRRKLIACTACLLGAGSMPLASVAQTQTTRIQPTLDVQALYTDNANRGGTGPKQSDVLLSTGLGVAVNAIGANTKLNGQYRLNAVNYVHDSQADRILPSGNLNLHTDVQHQGLGVDANLASDQVQANFNSPQSSTPSTADTYTNTRYSLSPYISRPLDADTRITARMERMWLRSTQNTTALASRPDSQADHHRLLLTRRPTRLGYELEADYQTTHVSEQSEASQSQRYGKASLVYALTPETEVSLSAGREHAQVFARTTTDSVRGGRIQWQPSERTQLKAQVESRYFGTGWQVDANHRTPWLAFAFNSSRQPQTYTSSLGVGQSGTSARSLYDAMLTTRFPDPIERKKAVDELIASRNLPTTLGSTRDMYDLGASLRESTSGRLAIMGRRNTLVVMAGLNRSHALLLDATAPLSAPAPSTKEYYLDTQLNHRLTPYTTVTGGLRWTRAWSTPEGLAPTLTRDFSWLGTLNTSLSSDATATMGLKRQFSHSPSTTSVEESSMFVGLGYRF